MPTRYTPSVNILRDSNGLVHYYPTPNARRAAQLIEQSYVQGVRVFNLIGSFGTGKSAFLWAISQTVRGRQHYFEIPGLIRPKVEVIPLVGEYGSVRAFFERQFNDTAKAFSTEELFAEIYTRYHRLGKEEGLLVLMVDEFGKFLEYAAKHNPEEELYFLQQLAEFVNNPAHNILLLTALHQSFDAYSLSLNGAQRQEWLKVKGRFKEITFNEPVEQLLTLAGERYSSKQIPDREKKGEINKISSLFVEAKAFPFDSNFASSLALKLFPLELFSASVAALAMQRYGQNERSLFSFLEDTAYTGLENYDARSNSFYNLANLYDYLIFNYYSLLTSKYNPDFSAWSGIKNALERVESELGDIEQLWACQKLIKALGLLNVFASKGAKLDEAFWVEYAEKCLDITAPSAILQALSDRKIFLYRKFETRYVISEGTDVDIQSELLLAEDQVGEIEDIVGLLKDSFSLPTAFAKRHYYHTGTPRLFDFIISSSPKTEVPLADDTDGYINLIFNEKIGIEQVLKVSRLQSDAAVLYGCYQNTSTIRNLLREIEKTKKTKDNIPQEDRVAQRELSNILQHQKALLNHYVLKNMYDASGGVAWIFAGELQQVRSNRDFNALLSRICDQVYHQAPVYQSELVNRSKLSSQIHSAKRSYFRNLVEYWGDEDLGFEKGKFPPEKTIYLTLLREHGLVPDVERPHAPLEIAAQSSFLPLWQFGEAFLHKAKKHRYPLSDLADAMGKAPFKLKKGLIDFWLPTFLFLKRDEFALFSEGIYIPSLSAETLELIAKRPQDFSIKAFDVKGVRLEIFNAYRQLLNQSPKDKADNGIFIETIRPFLTFYKRLPEYAKHTQRLQKESIAIRDAIAKATDPEKTFFEDFPRVLGLTLRQLKQSPEALSAYIAKIQDSIREIRTCYDELVNRFEAFITAEVLYEPLSFSQYQGGLQKRFSEVKQHLLLPHHKKFLQRLSSALDDRTAWLNSVAQALIGKSLENLRDEEEALLYDRFKSTVLELDSLVQLSEASIEEDKEEALKLEITSFEVIQKSVVRYPKKKASEISGIESGIKMQLGKDKTLNIVALANVLKDLLGK